MFFVLAKIFWFFAQPLNFAIFLGLAGLWRCCSGVGEPVFSSQPWRRHPRRVDLDLARCADDAGAGRALS